MGLGVVGVGHGKDPTLRVQGMQTWSIMWFLQKEAGYLDPQGYSPQHPRASAERIAHHPPAAGQKQFAPRPLFERLLCVNCTAYRADDRHFLKFWYPSQGRLVLTGAAKPTALPLLCYSSGRPSIGNVASELLPSLSGPLSHRTPKLLMPAARCGGSSGLPAWALV